LIKVDYSFETESVLYDVVENKAKAPSTYVAGNFSFESLHHDLEGGMLGRYRTNNCGNVPDVYVSFVQGGNNIQEVLYDATQFPDEKPRWNFIYAMINTIYTPAENGEGDNQYVDTVYGKCEVQFGRPEDKRFRRKINGCEIKSDEFHSHRWAPACRIRKSTPISWLSMLLNCSDSIHLCIINGDSLLRAGTHVEITNRTMNYVPRHCNSDTKTAAECAKDKFGAVPVGKNSTNKFASTSVLRSIVSNLFGMGEFTHMLQKHSQIVRGDCTGRKASHHVLGNVLGALGNSQSLKIAREVLLVEGPEFLDDYLLGAAHTTSNDEKWHKQLMYWMADMKKDEATYWKIANTVATVLQKRCDRTPSTRNSCQRGKEKIVAKFIGDISACKTEECHLKSLEILQNIPISQSFEHARGFLCSSSHSAPVQIAALQLIKAASPTLYDSKLANVLIRLFRDVCPQPTSTGESQLAIDILVKCIPEQQHVATMLLRTETLNPENPEKWQYFYKAVSFRSVAAKSELFGLEKCTATNQIRSKELR
ncbi:hypothetical protein COOONC_08463, partial [Cooperia oncophora]